MKRTKKNPAGVPLTDAAILIASGVLVGGLAWFFYTKWQDSQSSTTADNGGPQQVPGASPGVVQLGQGGTSGGLPLGQTSTTVGSTG